ncbi:UDP-4-amino-4-deoxy-L-arabinose--oxoglutarate aminotransferase [Vibrio sp. 10N.286.49.C2]|uniref:aminotransferase class I/II-fold pyridoxal phosphate-dependent enzyme n=1 Tax=unclassified Vibrio TaxID=2614977 RepID=UPI000C8461CB|nr:MULTISPECIES: aminotransferase class I/II-fold pyridoxal phosphate-dependent enzyme [unclassified Vibrio]PMH31407.1 UDP-4-amino-4-deoxy-L-arabinose--oxoglutarate aminotransferase [Vibrio sp. 10N.286.49.C2]PMH50428.1 UDP-4-amino-4-deoxy-L-arabinose--oxoglutarate aminotransferase [Vibrio sp. 10N.286.49.B1]PMH81274.1 UDP-4-amino-4-deoxy-L-arabinose--oxoglutarate aminotransferase [Vibrio sp. 10N.286.48.B7]
MSQSFLPLCRPAVDENDIQAVVDVLRSGWITTGPKNADLEKKISTYTGAPQAVALSSATAGMHLVLLALGIGPGDEVITPSLTWVSTINMITLVGAKPVFVDVDAETLMTDAEKIAPLITDKTKLIVPVHYAGASLDLDPIYALGEQHGIPVVEDAAHALGAEYKGQPIGSRGTCLFSMHAIKNVTTAEGGVMTTFDSELADKIRRLKFHGLGVDAFDRETQGRAPQAEVIEPGFKYNMPDICAVLALGQMDRIADITQARTDLALNYRAKLSSLKGVTPLGLASHDHKHCWHLMIVRIDPAQAGLTRDELIAKLKEKGIGAGIHFKACHTQKYYRENYADKFGAITPNLANTERNSDQICSLPLFPDMTQEDVARVVNAVSEIIG